MYALYLIHHTNGQMHMCLIASSIKDYYQARCCCVLIQVSQDGFMLRLICVFLGYDMPIQLVLSSEYDNYDRSEDVTDYKICNILCLNK